MEVVARGIASFAPAFGRAERVHVNGSEAILLLAKNHAGFNEVLRTMLRTDGGPVALIAINDLTADGRDVSWLWDVDFEMLAGRVRHVVVSGIRAEDMALRLKYAGVDPAALEVQKDLATAFDAARVASGADPLYVLPTYTAMLQLRAALQRRGVVRDFWDD
jgi:UDP-N-acetylmuramyl tripeptide synthase